MAQRPGEQLPAGPGKDREHQLFSRREEKEPTSRQAGSIITPARGEISCDGDWTPLLLPLYFERKKSQSDPDVT